MIHYLYDGTPVGLLCALAAALRAALASPQAPALLPLQAREPVPPQAPAPTALLAEGRARAGEDRQEQASIVHEARCQPGLFDETRRVASDPALAEEFLRTLAQRLPAPVFQDLFYCFFTGELGTETTVLAYVRMLLATGGRAADDWADETVRHARGLSQRIRYEIQRFHGIVRFRRLEDGTYYAQVEPDHAILPLLAPHFAARFPDQVWLIHDLRRNTGIYHARGARGEWVFLPEVERQPALQGVRGGPERSDGREDACQDLWRAYFREIAVPARVNPKLQRQHVPQRYWRNMVELSEVSAAGPVARQAAPGRFGGLTPPTAVC